MSRKFAAFLLGAFFVSSCASTSVTQLSRNEVLISTSAAPACGRSGAAHVASRMAAVETLRRGFQRYIILGASAENNVSAVSTGPTYATTTGGYNVYGNTVHGSSTTTFGGNRTILLGSNDADLRVLMLNPGDRGFSEGVDAKSTLGSNWSEIVEKGINTCTD